MSGLGSALQNIGQQWSQRISDKESEERLAKKQEILERRRLQNSMELARFEFLLKEDALDLERRSPEYQEKLKREKEAEERKAKESEAKRAYYAARSGGPPPKEVGGYIYEYDPELREYVQTGTAVQKPTKGREEEEKDPLARLMKGLGYN